MSRRNVERRAPRSAALRRLIAAGNLLAFVARGSGLEHGDLADAWDKSVDALRADLTEPRCYGDIPDGGVALQHFNCRCVLPESTS